MRVHQADVKEVLRSSATVSESMSIDGWTTVRLGDPDVATNIMGQSPASSTYNKEGIGLPFFQGKIDFGLRHPRPSTWCSSPLKIAEAGDILISVRAPVGDVNIAVERCCIGRGISALRPGSKVFNEFLFYLLLHHKPDLDALGTGATFKAINKNTLYSFEIQLPPFLEQRAIAAVLSKIQAAVEVQEKIVATLKELKAATMAKLFREGLRGELLKQTEIGEIPGSWGVARLDALANLLSGGTPSKRRPEWWQGTIPWVSPKDMKQPRLWDAQDHITEDALENGSCLVPTKTVFVVIRGMILAKDLPVAITEVPMAFNQDIKAVLTRESVDPDYLLYAIASRKGALVREIGTSAHGTRRMGTSSLEALLLPLPAKVEQREIAAAMRCLEQREETASKKLCHLRLVFSSMLHLLMTGQVRVKSVASALGANP